MIRNTPLVEICLLTTVRKYLHSQQVSENVALSSTRIEDLQIFKQSLNRGMLVAVSKDMKCNPTIPLSSTPSYQRLGIVIATLLLLRAICLAQNPMSDHKADIVPLLSRLKSESEQVASSAAAELIKIGPQAASAVTDFMNTEMDCSARVFAASVLNEIDPKNTGIAPVLAAVIKNKCYSSSQRDLVTRRGAGFVLALTPAGIRALTEMLNDKSTFVRQVAAFAFDERTEALVNAEPEIIAAVKEAIPALIRAAEDKDYVVRGVAAEALDQIVDCRNTELRNLVKESLKQRKR